MLIIEQEIYIYIFYFLLCQKLVFCCRPQKPISDCYSTPQKTFHTKKVTSYRTQYNSFAWSLAEVGALFSNRWRVGRYCASTSQENKCLVTKTAPTTGMHQAYQHYWLGTHQAYQHYWLGIHQAYQHYWLGTHQAYQHYWLGIHQAYQHYWLGIHQAYQHYWLGTHQAYQHYWLGIHQAYQHYWHMLNCEAVQDNGKRIKLCNGEVNFFEEIWQDALQGSRKGKGWVVLRLGVYLFI